MRLPWNSSVKRRSKSTRRGPSSDSPAGCSMAPPPKMPQAAGNKTKFRRFAPAQCQSSGKSGVKKDSPYQKVEDLKGKNLGLVDPNSTSGNNVPRFELNKMGITNADNYFGKVVFAGSHENAVLALAQGTVDIAANQWTSDDDSTLAQMLTKGMLKNADGSAMKKEDFRIIHKSEPIINGPYALNSDLPEEAKAAIEKAFFDAPAKDTAAYDRLSGGQKKGFHHAAA